MVRSMILPRFELEAPEDLTAACAVLGQAGEEARVLAGGTDLLVKMKRGELAPRLLLSLGRLEGLDRVESMGESGLRLGALTTMSRLAASSALAGPFRALAEGAASVAGPLIRNRATVGGNIVSARPCADTVPPLIALGAQVELESTGGSRRMDLDGFVLGPGKSDIRTGEILTGIALPASSEIRRGSCYLKITRRGAMEVTIVGCAANVILDEAGETVQAARIVLTSVAPVPLRTPTAEKALIGRAPNDEALRNASAAARRSAAPIDDHRAPAVYRSEMVEVITRRALQKALARAANDFETEGRPPS